MRYRIALVVLAVVSSTLVMPQPAVAAGPSLIGGGSTFAGLSFTEWTTTVSGAPYDIKIDYQGLGSGGGRSGYADGTLDFGASDIPYPSNEQNLINSSSRRDFVYLPVSAGGVAFPFNVRDSNGQRIENLALTPRLICRIFTTEMMWDDAELVKDNPQLLGVNKPIRKIVREDNAGTSYVLSEFCIDRAPDVWTAFITNPAAFSPGNSDVPTGFFNGNVPTSKWPLVGQGGSAAGADQVAQSVADSIRGENSITYEATGYAIVYRIPYASVLNSAGVYVRPDPTSITVALGYAQEQGNGTFRLQFAGSDPRAYFPSTYTYVIAQTSGFAADKGDVLGRFLCYAVTKGQESVEQYNYARLSSVLVELSRSQISKIPGAPTFDKCTVEGASAPPPPVIVAGGSGTVSSGAGGGGGGGGGGGASPGGAGAQTLGAGAAPGSGAAGGTGATAGGGTGAAASAGGSGAGGGATSAGGATAAAGSGGTTAAGGSAASATGVTGAAEGTAGAAAGAAGDELGASTSEAGSVAIDPETGAPLDPSAPGAAQVATTVARGAQTTAAGGSEVALGPNGASASGGIGGVLGRGIDNLEVVWLLVLGAGLCAGGMALATARRRVSS